MSVLEDLKGIEQRLIARMDELRPALEEYRQLEEAARRLGLDAQARTRPASKPRAGAKPSTASAPRPRRRRTASGVSRRDQVLALVNERPGVTVPVIGKELKVDPTGLYRVVRGLEKEGLIRKEGTELRPGKS
jgi:hypothetical protein